MLVQVAEPNRLAAARLLLSIRASIRTIRASIRAIRASIRAIRAIRGRFSIVFISAVFIPRVVCLVPDSHKSLLPEPILTSNVSPQKFLFFI
ncbi:hypothetical protein [Dickeya oryzae]|uniref:hypothetical protein n=1 Tax=Dickeya oryzae TaxID=1240404 RepID=UPI001AEC9274|nr:hypothetical protein [Dickeya oryzae]MBP2850875.1 hypothetical protein [Dickeya oryzae]